MCLVSLVEFLLLFLDETRAVFDDDVEKIVVRLCLLDARRAAQDIPNRDGSLRPQLGPGRIERLLRPRYAS